MSLRRLAPPVSLSSVAALYSCTIAPTSTLLPQRHWAFSTLSPGTCGLRGDRNHHFEPFVAHHLFPAQGVAPDHRGSVHHVRLVPAERSVTALYHALHGRWRQASRAMMVPLLSAHGLPPAQIRAAQFMRPVR
jgi:hypothetical protein